ncbi:branched-chain amino acid ABC transporter permease, partial [Mycobacterium tuberculosis]
MTKALNLSPAQLRIAEAAFWLALASSFFLLPDKLTLMSQVMIFGLFAVSLD